MWSMLTEEVTLVHECRSLDSMSSSLPRYPRTPRRPRRRARSTPTLDSVVSRVSRSLVSSYDYVLLPFSTLERELRTKQRYTKATGTPGSYRFYY
jgi:hypothetical protein